MTKDELITMLSSIEGNPQIIIWNGHVGDYQHISQITPFSLVKATISEYCFRLECERIVDTGNRNYKLSSEETAEMQELLDATDWEINKYVTTTDITEGRYEEQKVFIIEPQPRGVSSFDRYGKIEY